MIETNKVIAAIAIAIIATAIIVGGGVYLWMSPKTTTTQPAIQVSPTGEQAQEGQQIEQPSAQEQPQVDEYAGWKTYTNEEYGFEFKYPDDFKLGALVDWTNPVGIHLDPSFKPVNIETADEGTSLFTVEIQGPDSNKERLFGVRYILGISKTNYEDIDKYFDFFRKDFEGPKLYEGITVTQKIVEVKDIFAGDKKGKEFFAGDQSGIFLDTGIIVINNGLLYRINYYGELPSNETDKDKYKYRKLLEEILSTFKFTK